MLQQFLAQDPDQGIIVHQQNGGRRLFGHVQPRVAAVTAPASLALSKGTGFWNSIRRLKTGASVIRDKGRDRELAKFTACFAWLRLTLEELARFSITCWEYYSAVVGNILNSAGGFFCEGLLPDHD